MVEAKCNFVTTLTSKTIYPVAFFHTIEVHLSPWISAGDRFGPALMAKGFIVLAIFFTYTLQFYVPMEIVWRNTKQRVAQKHHNLAQAIMRAVFAAFTVASAATLPRLEQVIGLEGAFFYSFLGLIAPSIMHLIFYWERDLGKYNWVLIKDMTLILFGSFVLVTGVMQSIVEIIRTNK